MTNPLIINLCPTGMVPSKKTSPYIPLTPQEIAKDVKRCYELGVSIAHLHARDTEGEATWDPQVFEEILGEVCVHVPDIILVVTTSGRNWSEFEKRAACLSIHGKIKPEMASLTLGSMNFPKSTSVNSPDMIKALATKMMEEEITPELEVFDTGMLNYAKYLIESQILKPPYYFNILLGSLGTATLSAANIAAILSELPINSTWALAGVGRYQLAANTIAIALGGHIRIGMEDNPYYNWENREHATNPRLVERILRIAKEHGREPATPAEARKIIGLKNPPLRKIS